MRQLSHDVRIVYIDNTDDTVQNCYNHQFKIDNPNSYASRSLNLGQIRTFNIQDVNYLYISAQYPIRVVIDGSNEIICEHLSWINTEQTSFITITSNDVAILENNVQILYGTSDPVLTP